MERFTQKLLRFDRFILRILRYYVIGTVFFFIGILPGVLGFYLIEGHSIMESSLNAISMLSGQPVEPTPATPAGRFFIAIYGLFLQCVFILSIALVVTPFIHRQLHKWHLEED